MDVPTSADTPTVTPPPDRTEYPTLRIVSVQSLETEILTNRRKSDITHTSADETQEIVAFAILQEVAYRTPGSS